MIPRSPTPFLVACVLASAVSCLASTIDDNPYLVYPYLEDSVRSSTNITGPEGGVLVENWVVQSRDAKGRPLVTRKEISNAAKPELGSSFDTRTFTWALPVELPIQYQGRDFLIAAYFQGCTSFPSQVLLEEGRSLDSTSYFMEFRTAWNPTDRSLTVSLWYNGSNTMTGPSPWRDSLVFDAQNRAILEVVAGWDSVDGAEVRRNTTRILHFENPTDTRPRWTSEHSEDTSEVLDSVYYFGPVNRPTHATRVRRKDGKPDAPPEILTGSLEWDAEGHLVSHHYILGTSLDSSTRVSETTTWESGKLTRWQWTFANADTVGTLVEAAFTYGSAGTAIRSRSARPFGLSRTSRGLVVIPRNSTAPALVEWVGFDGRRQSLRIVATSESSLAVAPPRGLGVLRVTQDGRTKIHPVANF